jgi:hypothetical protein
MTEPPAAFHHRKRPTRGTISARQHPGLGLRFLERLTVDQEVGGSTPPSCTNKINSLYRIMAQWATKSLPGKRPVNRKQRLALFGLSAYWPGLRFRPPPLLVILDSTGGQTAVPLLPASGSSERRQYRPASERIAAPWWAARSHVASEVVDRGLVLLERSHVVLEAAPAFARCGRFEAGEGEEGVAAARGRWHSERPAPLDPPRNREAQPYRPRSRCARS